MPEVVKDAALSAWRELGEEKSFAVRSSATVEDAAGMSFAGQFESILKVRGADALLDCHQDVLAVAFLRAGAGLPGEATDAGGEGQDGGVGAGNGRG